MTKFKARNKILVTSALPYANYFKFSWLMFIWVGFIFLIMNPRTSKISQINTNLGFNLTIILLAMSTFLFTFAERTNKILKQKLLYISLNLFKYSILLLIFLSIGTAMYTNELNKLTHQQSLSNINFLGYMILQLFIMMVLFAISLQLTNLLNIINKEYELSKHLEKQIKEIKLR